ncbi:cysteine dioxygenase [Metabacillus sp. HB246100]|uniref:cysteine dioxygenase n=1 Tax=Bacillus weihaiensis TaxID=1547283 RepID=UPI0023540414|nr:cysteine dioxygenase family protein [Bacillus weihaiensis]
MNVTERISIVLSQVKDYGKDTLLKTITDLDISSNELNFSIEEKGKKRPYERKLLYKDENVELLVMNWSDLECAPHDHGQSFGWIKVLEGKVKNTVYEVKGDFLPTELFEEQQDVGSTFYAPIEGVHKMSGSSTEQKLVTLHLYSPPITGMKVYDLEKCAACVVSDDCGAWWPEEQVQKVKEIKMRKAE